MDFRQALPRLEQVMSCITLHARNLKLLALDFDFRGGAPRDTLPLLFGFAIDALS